MLTVVAGWLLTAFVYLPRPSSWDCPLRGGKIAIAIMVLLVVFLLYKSSRLHTRLKDREERQQQFLSTEAELITETNKELHRVMEKALSVYKRNIEGLKDEDRRTMKRHKEANDSMNGSRINESTR